MSIQDTDGGALLRKELPYDYLNMEHLDSLTDEYMEVVRHYLKGAQESLLRRIASVIGEIRIRIWIRVRTRI